MISISKELMIKRLIEKFKEKNFQVLYANYEGYPTPDKIRDYTPDVIGIDNNEDLYQFGIVTTPDEIQSDHTTKKLENLSGMMMSKGMSEGKRIPAHLAIPKQCETSVNEHLQKTGMASQGNIITVEL